jgi:hypothetical protein
MDYPGTPIKDNWNAGDTIPGATDDISEGYRQGSRWRRIFNSSYSIYICIDATEGAAVWVIIAGIGVDATLLTLHGKVDEAAGISKGDVVYPKSVTGDNTGFALADKDSPHFAGHPVGVSNSEGTVANGNDIEITIIGVVEGLNTIAYAPGTVLYLDNAGGWVNPAPFGRVHVHIGSVKKQNASSGSINVFIVDHYVHRLIAEPGGHANILLDDNAGVSKMRVWDSDEIEVMNVDSNGMVNSDEIKGYTTPNDTTIAGIPITASKAPDVNISIQKIGSPTYDTQRDFNVINGSAGLITNTTTVTDAGSGTIDIAERQAFVRSTDLHLGEMFSVVVPSQSGVTIPTDTTRFVGFEYNAGTPQYVLKTTETWNYHTEAPVACVVNEGGTLHIFNNPQWIADASGHTMDQLYNTGKLRYDENTKGLIIEETGTRNITLSAGALYSRNTRFPISALDTSVSDNFDTYSAGGKEATAATQWDNQNYDNGGTLTALGPNKFAVHWWYIEADGCLVMVYGTGEYATIASARNEGIPTTLPDRIAAHGKLVARAIFQKDGTTYETIDSAFAEFFSGAAVSSKAVIVCTIDGGGSAITTGEKAWIRIPYNAAITGHELTADQTGSIVIDIWKDTYTNYPPTDADSITASAPPTLSSAQKAQDNVLTGWTTAISAGDYLKFNVDSVATVTKISLNIQVNKTGV